ncbi:MAG: CPBP family intramembrane metalloprotease [Erysipelotrichales bacterium]|nr:CPBP family intramembrane metalloprotease [Erysipelotrichales bacterium]
MEDISVYSDDWYRKELISGKKIIFLLVYYFIFYLYVAPNVSYRILCSFMEESVAYQYAQLTSDFICMWPIIYLAFPLLKYSWNGYLEEPSHIMNSGIKLYIPMILGNALVQGILQTLTGLTNGANQDIANTLFEMNPLSIAIPAIMIAPIIEEIIFRGLIFRSGRVLGFPIAALISGLSFGLIHCIGDILSGNWLAASFIIMYACMGMFMCKAHENGKNLISSISLHMFSNTIAVLAMMYLA